MSVLLWCVVVLAVALACSPRLRSALVSRVLFPAGYFLYTQRVPGYTLHRTLMSSAAKSRTPHTKIDHVTKDGSVQVVPIPVLDDNYSYLILHEASKTAALVDPADPYPITQVLQTQYPDYKLQTILTTHKHWDHAGGNIELAKQFPSLTIVGGKDDGVAGATKEVSHGDSLQLGDMDVKASVFACPCHTRGHVLYKIGRVLFTGDTLFVAGCGKFFEGSAAEMHRNLVETIGALPDDTIIFPGHEYTVGNLEFAAWVEPGNEVVQSKFEWAKERRAGLFPTVPSTLADEKSFNPFMRVAEPAVVARVSRVVEMQALDKGSKEMGVKVMEALRTLKNENAHKKK